MLSSFVPVAGLYDFSTLLDLDISFFHYSLVSSLETWSFPTFTAKSQELLTLGDTNSFYILKNVGLFYQERLVDVQSKPGRYHLFSE